MKPTLVILAAGKSTRFGRLKQLEPVGPSGETLLDYAAFDAWRAGFCRVVLIIQAESEGAFREHIRPRWPTDLEVVFHHQRLEDVPRDLQGVDRLLEERTKPWGTAHALLSARSHLSGPFVILNADDFYGTGAFMQAATLVELSRSLEGDGPSAFALVAYTLRDTLHGPGGVNRGLCRVGREGWLESVEEVVDIRKTDGEIMGETISGETVYLSGAEPISTNFWIFTPEVFPFLDEGFRRFLESIGPRVNEPEFLIPTEVNRVVRGGEARVRVRRSDGPFLGITHPEDQECVMAELKNLVDVGRYSSPLWAPGGGDESCN